MQITFEIDQKEAIRRGVDCASTAKLDLDLSEFDEVERQVLADHFVTGQFKACSDVHKLKEPTSEGVHEMLTDIRKKAIIHEARQIEQDEEECKRVRNLFESERRTYGTTEQVFASRSQKDGKIVDRNYYCSEFEAHPTTYWSEHRIASYGQKAKNLWEELKASDEGQKIQREMDRGNELARAQAFEQAAERLIHRENKEAQNKKDLEAFEAWAKTHSPGLLGVLIDEDLDWHDRAMSMLLDSVLSYCQEDDVRDVSYDVDSEVVISEESLASLADIRDALSELPDWAVTRSRLCSEGARLLIEVDLDIGPLRVRSFHYEA